MQLYKHNISVSNMVKAIRTMNKTAGTIDVDIPTDMWEVDNPDGGAGFELGKMTN